MTPGERAGARREEEAPARPLADTSETPSAPLPRQLPGQAPARTPGQAASQSAAPARALGALTLGLTLGALLLARAPTPRRTTPPRARGRGRPSPGPAAPIGGVPSAAADAARHAEAPEARQLFQAAAMLAASVLSDSALEHYRGGFENPGMFAPLASSALVLASALNGARSPSAARRGARRAAPDRGTSDAVRAPGLRASLPYTAACAVGLAGFGFHVYNVLRRPGGLSWGNLFYAAPLGAPAALSLAGLLGLAARRVESGAPTLAGLPTGQALCALGAVGMAGTSMEAGLLHFRGAFQHPAMWLPVSLPPVGAALLARAAVRAPTRARGLARAVLDACTWLGLSGMGFHARGVARQMGGWRNWSQNLLSGPPLPAPPSFSALALAGRAALALRARDAARDGIRRPA